LGDDSNDYTISSQITTASKPLCLHDLRVLLASKRLGLISPALGCDAAVANVNTLKVTEPAPSPRLASLELSSWQATTRPFATLNNDIPKAEAEPQFWDRVRVLIVVTRTFLFVLCLTDPDTTDYLQEDNLFNQMVLRGMLEALGLADISVAENGQEAVSLMETAMRSGTSSSFTLVIMDCYM
jgi:hypothetical protein